MKYYSEITNKIYNTTDELKEAEELIIEKQKKEQAEAEEKRLKLENLKKIKNTRKAEVDKAFDEVDKARIEANNLMEKYVKDYGRYEYEIQESSGYDIFDDFIKHVFGE